MEPKITLNRAAFTEYLGQNNLSIHKLASLMKVEPSTLYRAFNDNSAMSSATMAKMMNALGLKSSDFATLFIFKPVLHKNNSNEIEA
ncbi:hypothetical protein BSQ39_08320 [Loigolactobacillus backii]|uniref:helix-turn-helix transcriptional regulator n=1 Tax=Loigolactobacillus backii TaxID=375175 RepID=UPI000C1C861E|nr:helix-turn-helix transcriptional regulator [Loigolactobacillus backii]PIO83567.1 hypothetical protein BSQ39_08320 [Loigolactobacillus backii]